MVDLNKKLINKKSEINQVFVYLFSAIIILFVGFMVIKFISSFGSDTEDKFLNDFTQELDTHYTSVYTTYSSEKTYDYKLPSKITKVCFLTKKDCIDKNLFPNDYQDVEVLFDSGDNVVLFDVNGIYRSKKLKTFYTDGKGCFCTNTTLGRFTLDYENRRNKVYILEHQK